MEQFIEPLDKIFNNPKMLLLSIIYQAFKTHIVVNDSENMKEKACFIQRPKL